MEIIITKIPFQTQETIRAIKYIRNAFSLTLKDAKCIIDSADNTTPVPVNIEGVSLPVDNTEKKKVLDGVVRDLATVGYHVTYSMRQLVSCPDHYIGPLRDIASAAVIAGDYVVANPIIQLLQTLEPQQ